MNTSQTNTYKLIHKDGIAYSILDKGGVTMSLNDIFESEEIQDLVDFARDLDMELILPSDISERELELLLMNNELLHHFLCIREES